MYPSSAETRQFVFQAIGGDHSAIEQLLAQFRPQLRRMVAVRMDSRLKARKVFLRTNHLPRACTHFIPYSVAQFQSFFWACARNRRKSK